MKRIFCIAAVAISFCTAVSAQHNLRTGYFLDGYAYRHKLNPAFAGDRGYVAIPAAGYLTAGVESNLTLSTLLYPTGNGTLTTFLNPSVSAEEFLSRIRNNKSCQCQCGHQPHITRIPCRRKLQYGRYLAQG